MKKVVSIFFSLILFVSILPVSSASANSAHKEIEAMVAQGIMTGYANGNLALNENVSRGQFATFLTRALKLPEGEHRFKDVPKSSALAFGINAAASAGLISGYSSTTFAPNNVITREQMAMLLDRTMKYLKIPTKAGELAFVDRQKITPSAINAVSNMVGHKIMLGTETSKGVMFIPQEKATRENAAIYLYRLLEIYDNRFPQAGDDGTDPEVPVEPPTPSPVYPFAVGTVDQSGTVKAETTTYKTFNEVNKVFNSNANGVILHNNKIIKMNDGIAVAKVATKGSATNVYDANLKTVKLAVMYGSEMEYVTSDESKITVKVAGELGYVKHSDAYLQPEVAIEQRSYYIVDAQRNLKHSIYNPVSNTSSSYVYGKAPAALEVNEKYNSWDGATFTKEDGTAVGTFYQYFNMLPYRTTTNYSANELEAIINKKLQYVESLYKSNPKSYVRYMDATKKSKLIGLGKVLKDYEKTYKINALTVLSTGIIEGDYGMSANAQNKNNLFGIKVYDSNPSAGTSFKTPRDSVTELINQYLNKNYIPVKGAYANSGILGNKSRGVNVRYATDPNWGQKIAGRMYELDKEMGGKDFINNPSLYQLYETTKSTNVYALPTTLNSSLVYTYSKSGFVFAVKESVNQFGISWYKILSDSNSDLYGYLNAQNARPLKIAK